MKNNKIDISNFFKSVYEDSIVFSKKVLKSIKIEFKKLEKNKKRNIIFGYSIVFLVILIFLILLNILYGHDTSDVYSYEDFYDYSYTIDYLNEKDFEKDLNDGKNVYGKVVKFLVNDYKPNSELGINTWSGEHLNFISYNEIEVKKGDFVIGKVTEEPYKVLGSWTIKYSVLRIERNCIVNSDYNNDNKIPSQDSSVNNATMSDDKNKQDNTDNEEENSYTKPIENNTTVEKETVKYNFYTTNSSEDAKLGNKGKFSYVENGVNYDVYWIIDFDEGYVYNFYDGNGDDYCYKIKIKSGNLNDGVTLSYKDKNNEWIKYIHFKYANQSHQLIVVDNDLHTYEYETVSLKSSLELRDSKKIHLE